MLHSFECILAMFIMVALLLPYVMFRLLILTHTCEMMRLLKKRLLVRNLVVSYSFDVNDVKTKANNNVKNCRRFCIHIIFELIVFQKSYYMYTMHSFGHSSTNLYYWAVKYVFLSRYVMMILITSKILIQLMNYKKH